MLKFEVSNSNIIKVTNTKFPDLEVGIVDKQTSNRSNKLSSSILMNILQNILMRTDINYLVIIEDKEYEYQSSDSEELSVYEDDYGAVVFSLNTDDDSEDYFIDLKIVKGTFEDLYILLEKNTKKPAHITDEDVKKLLEAFEGVTNPNV